MLEKRSGLFTHQFGTYVNFVAYGCFYTFGTENNWKMMMVMSKCLKVFLVQDIDRYVCNVLYQ